MNYSDAQNFISRRDSSANAKKVLLERFKARPGPDDPIMRQRQIERQAIAEARAARDVEKAAARAEKERLAVLERARIEEERRLAEVARESERRAELARIEAERPRKVLQEAVQYMRMRSAGKRR